MSDLSIVERQQNGPRLRIEATGGKLYLDELEKAHADYGKALGVTAPMPGLGKDGPVIRAALWE